MPTLCSLALAIWPVQGIPTDAPVERPEFLHGFGRGFTWAGDWDGDGRRDLALSMDRAVGLVVLSSGTGEPIARFEVEVAWSSVPTVVAVPDTDGDGVIDLLVATRMPSQPGSARRYLVGLVESRERTFRPLQSFLGSPPCVVGLPPRATDAKPAWAYFSSSPHGVSELAVVDFAGETRWRKELPGGLVPPGVVLSSAPPQTVGGDARLALGLAGRVPNESCGRPAVPALAGGGAVVLFDAADGTELGRLGPRVPHVGYGCGVLALPSVDGAPPSLWIAAENYPEKGAPTHSFFEHVGAAPAPKRSLLSLGSPDGAGLLDMEPKSVHGPRYAGAFAWVRIEFEGAAVDVLVDANPFGTLGGAVRGVRLDTSAPMWVTECPDWENRDYGFGRTLAGEEWWAPGTTGGRILAGTWSPYGGPPPGVYELDGATGRVITRHPRAARAGEATPPR